MDKILRINMSAPGGPAVKTEALGTYAGLGGRAMTSTVVAKEVPPTCHPLGVANKLVIAPGLLSGSAAAMSGRVSVGCKSPLTGGIKEANSGGQAAQVMARLGYAAIILEGESKTTIGTRFLSTRTVSRSNPPPISKAWATTPPWKNCPPSTARRWPASASARPVR